MQPGGILAVLNDIDAACDRPEYEDWYQRDHMPDRLAVPVLAAAHQAAAALGLPGPASLYSLLYASLQDAPAP